MYDIEKKIANFFDDVMRAMTILDARERPHIRAQALHLGRCEFGWRALPDGLRVMTIANGFVLVGMYAIDAAGWLHGLAVAPRYRGFGAGRRLLQDAVTRGARACCCFEPALWPFLRQAGFAHAGVRRVAREATPGLVMKIAN